MILDHFALSHMCDNCPLRVKHLTQQFQSVIVLGAVEVIVVLGLQFRKHACTYHMPPKASMEKPYNAPSVITNLNPISLRVCHMKNLYLCLCVT